MLVPKRAETLGRYRGLGALDFGRLSGPGCLGPWQGIGVEGYNRVGRPGHINRPPSSINGNLFYQPSRQSRCQLAVVLPPGNITPCHNYVGHNYIGHNYMGRSYIGLSYMGHNYVGHSYIGRDYIGHEYIRHGCLFCHLATELPAMTHSRPRPCRK